MAVFSIKHFPSQVLAEKTFSSSSCFTVSSFSIVIAGNNNFIP